MIAMMLVKVVVHSTRILEAEGKNLLSQNVKLKKINQAILALLTRRCYFFLIFMSVPLVS